MERLLSRLGWPRLYASSTSPSSTSTTSAAWPLRQPPHRLEGVTSTSPFSSGAKRSSLPLTSRRTMATPFTVSHWQGAKYRA